MKRRAFLGFLGGAAASGPSVAKAAAEMTVADLALGPAFDGGMPGGVGANLSYPTPDREWASEQLKRLLGKTAVQIAKEKRDYHVSFIDTNTAALRSMSLGAKLRMTREAQYERQVHREQEQWEGVISGLWSW